MGIFIPNEDYIFCESLRKPTFVGFSLSVGSRIVKHGTFISVGHFYSCKASLFLSGLDKSQFALGQDMDQEHLFAHAFA